jgi:DNA repair protein RecN (Recombination protein N)
MLTHLSIRDVVIVDKLDIDFAAGLCVLTGETGAGKSIVLDSLNLTLGGRADGAMIRPGAEKLSVTASFALAAKHPARAVLAEQDIAMDDDGLVLRRVVGADGRSRGFVNDQAVSIGLLKTLGDLLVEVHGQFETHGLLDPGTHIEALDAYRASAKGGAAADQACAKAWQAWRGAKDALTAAQETLSSALAEEDLLRHQVAELTTLDPKAGEEARLAAARAVLRHGEQIIKALADARAALTEGTDVENALRTAVNKVSKVAAQAGGSLEKVTQALERAAIEVSEAVHELDLAAGGMDADPHALENAEERLFALKAAARKHNTTVDELPALRERLTSRLAAIDNGADQVAKLAAAEKTARLGFEQAATTLSEARKTAAKTLDKLVAKELSPLKLDKATFRTVVAAKPETAWSEAGVDRVTFEVATNPGMPPGPLDKIASGGELARFMLALKVVLAGSQDRAVLIFDEVDAGISGATANAVGERLARLAKSAQVMVVTHAPQVAARGDHHWRVSKIARGGQTTTKVEQLDGPARREEIARMLAGEKITDEARAAADSLMSGPLS